jgi:hypothetical protein
MKLLIALALTGLSLVAAQDPALAPSVSDKSGKPHREGQLTKLIPEW